MGTNYYAVSNPELPDGEDWRGETGYNCRHIGKSSAGWCFSLHVYPEEGIESLTDWAKVLLTTGVLIFDEYKNQVSFEEMMCNIVGRVGRNLPADNDFGPGSARRELFGYTSKADFYGKNSAQDGPHGLMRHQLSRYCIGHGVGTWDLLVGDFS